MLFLVAGIAMSQVSTTIPDENLINGFAMGCQAWSFNQFTTFEAIERTAQAGGKVIELFPGQKLSKDDASEVGPDMPSASTQALMAKLASTGVKAIAFGVVGVDRDPVKARKLFAWAKGIGIGIINTESVDAIDTMDLMVKEFDMKVGFHDHPKTSNPNYRMWDPNYILSVVKDHDKRIGACADTGHWVRSGIKPVDALRILKGRVISAHLKDLNVFSADGHDVPYGTGVSDVPGILRELKSQGFKGSISVEYEYDWDRSLPAISQSIGFVRGFTTK